MNPLQRASAVRKAIYFAAILVLFTVSMVWRGTIPVPLGGSAARAAEPFRWAAAHTIQSQAQRLEVWEADPTEGEAEVSGAALRLALTGSRGIAVAVLWQAAIEKQKRNDFHEFEALVGAVTKLQPNFITPWLFQSWNISYNVSVEMQGSGDMYFYIVRGVQLLAEGERRNRRSPDMRWWVGFYNQNKFGVSDQVDTLRCLHDLSCMPPSARNPDNLLRRDPKDPSVTELDPEAFRRFCERYPHFVRRLRGDDASSQDKRAKEKLRAPRPEDVIRFLREHYQELPSRYRKDSNDKWTDDLADADKQFPVLPPQFNEGPNEAHPAVATPDEFAPVVGYFTAYRAARAWYSYANLLLPLAMRDEQGEPIPGPTPAPGTRDPSDPSRLLNDPAKHRVPRSPALMIFRQAAPRAQSFQAELEQKEGWFDGDGWRIEGWFPADKEVVVGGGRAWSLIEWQKAAEMWRQHGKDHALALTPERYASLQLQAGNFSTLPVNPTPEDLENPALRRRYVAFQALRYYNTDRQMTNFPSFLAGAEAEARVTNGQPLTVLARKTLWRADQARKNAEPIRAIQLYKDGLQQWKRVLADNPNFHRLPPPDQGDRVQEETYEFELAYQRLLVLHDQRVRNWADKLATGGHAVVPFLTAPFASGSTADPLWPESNKENLKWYVVENTGEKEFSSIADEKARKEQDFASPFVGSLARDGSPWVREDIKESVRSKQGVSRRPAGAAAPPGPPPAP